MISFHIRSYENLFQIFLFFNKEKKTSILFEFGTNEGDKTWRIVQLATANTE